MQCEVLRGLLAAIVLAGGMARADVGVGACRGRGDPGTPVPSCTAEAMTSAYAVTCQECAAGDASCADPWRDVAYQEWCVASRSGGDVSVLCASTCPADLPTTCASPATCPVGDPACGAALLQQGYAGYCQREGTAGREAVFCQGPAQARLQVPRRGAAVPAAACMLAASAVASVVLRRRRR